jgi:putative salt-induced outer membrane protein YdiY
MSFGLWAVLTGFLFPALLRADEVILANGDTLHGLVKKQTDQLVVFIHPNLGELTIRRTRIQTVIVEEVTEEEKQEILEEQAVDLITRLKSKGWQASLDLSLDGSYGNTNEQSLRIGAKVGRQTPEILYNLDSTLYHKIADDAVADNKFTLGVIHAWFFPENPVFLFASGRYDYDEFKSWNHRLNTHAGPGYKLIEKDTVAWALLGGLGARKEWGSLNDNTELEGLAGSKFNWKITARQSLEIDFGYAPVLEDFQDYRTRTTVNWRLAVGQHTSLLMGMLNEHQSVVDPGDERTDTRLYTGLNFGF